MKNIEAVGLRPGEILSRSKDPVRKQGRHHSYIWEMVVSLHPPKTVIFDTTTQKARAIACMTYLASSSVEGIVSIDDICILISREDWIESHGSMFSDAPISVAKPKLYNQLYQAAEYFSGKGRLYFAERGVRIDRIPESGATYKVIYSPEEKLPPAASEVQVWDQEATNQAIERIKNHKLRSQMRVFNQRLNINPSFKDIVLATQDTVGLGDQPMVVGTLLDRLMTKYETDDDLFMKLINSSVIKVQQEDGGVDYLFIKDQALVLVCILQKYFISAGKLSKTQYGFIRTYRELKEGRKGYHIGAWKQSEAELLKLFADTGFDRILQGKSSVVGVGKYSPFPSKLSS